MHWVPQFEAAQLLQCPKFFSKSRNELVACSKGPQMPPRNDNLRIAKCSQPADFVVSRWGEDTHCHEVFHGLSLPRCSQFQGRTPRTPRAKVAFHQGRPLVDTTDGHLESSKQRAHFVRLVAIGCFSGRQTTGCTESSHRHRNGTLFHSSSGRISFPDPKPYLRNLSF